MANDFSKEERVAFETLLEGFNDACVLANNVSQYKTDQQMMERSGDTIRRPMPYILPSYDGMDQTLNFKKRVQLSVPATIGYEKSVPWTMTAKELRDALQEGRLGEAAKQRLASDVNRAILDVATLQGSLVVDIATAAAGYADVALADALMNETGVMMENRYLALSSRDYNGMAGNLAVATRSFGNKKSEDAYTKGYVGPVAGFETYKLDYSRRLAAAAGGGALTMDTQAAALNYLVPRATSVAATGEHSNVDNRYQTVTINSTVGVAAGDCFTIAGVEACHLITKQSTGQLKTFRVISVTNATTMVISPGIISNQGGSEAEEQYQNCIVTPAANAALVFLNTTAAAMNPFWHRDALEILPGRYSIPDNAGVAVMRATTDQGLELVMQKWYAGETMDVNFRMDLLFGVCNKQPEMSGIILFGQV